MTARTVGPEPLNLAVAVELVAHRAMIEAELRRLGPAGWREHVVLLTTPTMYCELRPDLHSPFRPPAPDDCTGHFVVSWPGATFRARVADLGEPWPAWADAIVQTVATLEADRALVVVMFARSIYGALPVQPGAVGASP